MIDAPLCTRCRHYRTDFGEFIMRGSGDCARTKRILAPSRDIVSGRVSGPFTVYDSAYSTRHYGGCGMRGRWWEAPEPIQMPSIGGFSPWLYIFGAAATFVVLMGILQELRP